MGSSAGQKVCAALAVLGLIGTIVCCALPLWRVSAFTGMYISTEQEEQEGLWVQMVCVALGVIGLIGTIVCCALPLWKVSAFIGNNIVTAQEQQEGLWMQCVKQSTGQQQCKVYDSMLELSSDLQAARAMIIISCMLSGLSVLVLFCGADFTTCVQNEDAKPKICLVAGVGLLLGGYLVIMPVRLSAHITNNKPLIMTSQKSEVGACIYIGWAAGVMMVLAGGLLCWFSRPKSGSEPPKY
uniref:Claudin n=1 Tax=Fundulus heteroclitus TaxID=8078 RepID=A0A146YZQ5_FUNHE